jgi:hypothetical protein
MLERVQVQPDDVGRFGIEIRIIAGQVAFQAMRFELRLHQNPLYLLSPSSFDNFWQDQWVLPGSLGLAPRAGRSLLPR